jgi:hypothetical protein
MILPDCTVLQRKKIRELRTQPEEMRATIIAPKHHPSTVSISSKPSDRFPSIHPVSLPDSFQAKIVQFPAGPPALVVRRRLAVVADNLEAADHLADGEEAEALGEDDAAGDELGGADVADGLEDGLGGLEEAAGLDGSPGVLVVGLEGGDGAGWGSSCQ